MNANPHSQSARMSSALWQGWLRRSVRLYLALQEPGVDKLQVEARLRAVERQLIRYLLQDYDKSATVMATQQAWKQVEAAQESFLCNPAQVEELLDELSATQAIGPLASH